MGSTDLSTASGVESVQILSAAPGRVQRLISQEEGQCRGLCRVVGPRLTPAFILFAPLPSFPEGFQVRDHTQK